MLRLLFIPFIFLACNTPPARENPAVWNKVKMDFSKFDQDGLAGAENGKVAATYEFCIPKNNKILREVQKIDSTARVAGGRGRVACNDTQWLVFGQTNQPRFKKVLFDLASLPYIKEIQETFFE